MEAGGQGDRPASERGPQLELQSDRPDEWFGQGGFDFLKPWIRTIHLKDLAPAVLVLIRAQGFVLTRKSLGLWAENRMAEYLTSLAAALREEGLVNKHVLAIAIALVFAGALPAQEFRGTFSGTLTDAQGAAVAGAKIVAVETRTGAKSETVSDASGAYTIPFLTPGEYEITVEVPGFKKVVRQGLTLSIGEHPVIDMRLEVGAMTEAVTVTAESPLIEAANASIGQVITTREVEDFPLNGRVPLMLGQMALGVIVTTEAGVQVRPFDNNTPGSFSLGGATSGTNELLYNGAANTGYYNQIAYSPPQDAVTQVVVNAFESDASFGHTGGGTANLITKQGTNTFHGSLYEFNQVSALAANQFFSNKAGIPRPGYRYNQYGLSASGPMWVPKVFNGKNKVFWLFAWEGLRDSDPASSPRETANPTILATVPTDAERQGDFSALLKANTPGTNYTIYNPYSGVVSGTSVARTPFPNNVIPASLLNPIALKYLQYYPEPNTTGQINGFQNFNLLNAVDSDGYDNELARVDFNLGARNKLSADFRHSYRAQVKDNYLENVATNGYLYRKNQGASLDDVYTIAPTLVIDIRGNWTRWIQIHASASRGLDPTTLGFPSYIDASAEALLMPEIVINSTTVSAGSAPSFQSFGYTGNPDDNNTYDVFQMFGDIIKTSGNHTIKTGADIRDYRWSSFTYGNPSGIYTFNSSWTNGPLSTAAAAPLGQDFAAFLMGLPSSGDIDLNSQSTAGSKDAAFFVQDDWRARSNLTFNIGLRLEHETPTVERFNRSVNGFNPTAQNPISAAAAAAYAANPVVPQIPASQFSALGGLTPASAGSPDIYHTGSVIFSPRFGFAWVPGALGPRTVVRGGFGVFVVPIGIDGSGFTSSTVSLNQEGFSQTTQFVATNNNFLTPAGSLSNPFPTGILRPAGASGGAGTFLGQQVTFFNPQAIHPYEIRWTFGIQRELPGQMVLEVAYIGNHGVRLPVTTQLDYIPRQYLSTSPFRDQNTINVLTGTVANPLKGLIPNSSSLNGSTVALQQLLIPFPQYPVPVPPSSTTNGVVLQGNTPGSSYFQSLNVRLQKRLTNGLTLINNFVYSSLIDRLAYLNDSDPAPEKRVSSDSRPLREVLGATYDLPIGRGKSLDLRSRFGNSLVGGWKLNAMLTLQSGPMLAWGNVIYLGGPLNLQPHQPNGVAFNTSVFNTASSQQLADNIRTFDTLFGNLRRDPTKNVDMSVSKSFPFAEQKYLEIRIETFNTTNRVTFGAPSLSPTSTTFGVIGTQANSPRAVQLGARLVW